MGSQNVMGSDYGSSISGAKNFKRLPNLNAKHVQVCLVSYKDIFHSIFFYLGRFPTTASWPTLLSTSTRTSSAASTSGACFSRISSACSGAALQYSSGDVAWSVKWKIPRQ
jgi:hypothetical protein